MVGWGWKGESVVFDSVASLYAWLRCQRVQTLLVRTRKGSAFVLIKEVGFGRSVEFLFSGEEDVELE